MSNINFFTHRSYAERIHDNLESKLLPLQEAAGCALPETCVGGIGDPYLTVAAALAAGISRIKIRGNVTEPAGTVILLPAYVHIWVDGGVVWTIPADTTFDSSATVALTIEGNSQGTLVWSPTTSGQLLGTSAPTTTISFRNMELDLSGATAAVGPVQLGPQDALWSIKSCVIRLPNTSDIQLINTLFNPLGPTEASTFDDILFDGGATAIIGNLAGTALVQGQFKDITFINFATGDNSFTSPIIGVLAGIGGGVLIFDGLHLDTDAAVADAILSGSVSNITRRNLGGSPSWNVRMSGNGSHELTQSTISNLTIDTSNSSYSDTTASNLFWSATVNRDGNKFSNCILGSAVSTSLAIVGDLSLFSNCTLTAPSIAGGISITGDGNILSSCAIIDTGVGPDDCLTITGSDCSVIGCNKTGGSGTRNFRSTGGVRTIFSGNNLINSSGTTGTTEQKILASATTTSTGNIVDTATVGGVIAGELVV